MYNGYWTEKHHSLKNLSKYTHVLTTPLSYRGKMVKLNIFSWYSSSTSCLTKVFFIYNIFLHQKRGFSQPITEHNDEDSFLIGNSKTESLEIIWPL